MDARTDDTFLDWMSRFLFNFVDTNVGKMVKSLVRKQSCVETYFKVGFAAAPSVAPTDWPQSVPRMAQVHASMHLGPHRPMLVQ